MAVTKRKCKKCKGTIEIDKNNITGVVYYDNFYYHEQCFCDLCAQKIEKKRGGWTKWQASLDNLWQIEADTKQRIQQSRVKTDPLNDYLLEHYEVAAVPKNFWTAVADLGNGIYRSKRCKPIDVDTLLEAWKWGQEKLDKIAQNNRENRKGPSNDTERLRYDLAILMGHIEDYKKYKARVEAERAENEQESSNTAKAIDYSAISKVKETIKKENDDDISDMLDEIFG